MAETRFSTAVAEEAIARRLNLPWAIRMQDWALQVSDPKRLDEFISIMQTEQLSQPEQIALLALILASAEEAEAKGQLKASSWAEVRSILLAQPELFAGHVEYWALLDEHTEDVFPITPHMRAVLAELEKKNS